MKNTAVLPALDWLRVPNAYAVVFCLVLFTVGGVLFDPASGWTGVLTAALFGLSLSLGASIFIAINIVAGAKWWAPVRGYAIVIARTLPLPALVLVATLILGLSQLYPWARPGAMEASHLLHEKAAWLNVPFFLARAIIVLAIWLGMVALLTKRLVGVMEGAPGAAKKAARVAPIFILVFALSVSVAFWDWTMSLEPEWFSTMFGMYAFAGMMQGGIAAITILVILSHRATGYAKLSPNVLHDLGKLLFAFSMFWAYIWFCQYMLIWYANLPEETVYFHRRSSNGWLLLFVLDAVLCFFLPFLVLLSANVKKNPAMLLQTAIFVLVGRWLDLHLMVSPSANEIPNVPAYSVAGTIAVVILMILAGKRSIGAASR